MNADKDEWQQLVTALGEGALQYLNSDDDGRSAAIIQLKAVLQFLHAMDQKILTTPLHNLLNALMDLQYAKPAKILEPKKTAHRQRDDMALRMVKVVSAVIMDQLQEYAGLTRPEAATAVATALAKLGLSRFRGRSITATAVAKWRDQARQKNSTLSEQYEWKRAISRLSEEPMMETVSDLWVRPNLTPSLASLLACPCLLHCVPSNRWGSCNEPSTNQSTPTPTSSKVQKSISFQVRPHPV